MPWPHTTNETEYVNVDADADYVFIAVVFSS